MSNDNRKKIIRLISMISKLFILSLTFRNVQLLQWINPDIRVFQLVWVVCYSFPRIIPNVVYFPTFERQRDSDVQTNDYSKFNATSCCRETKHQWESLYSSPYSKYVNITSIISIMISLKAKLDNWVVDKRLDSKWSDR